MFRGAYFGRSPMNDPPTAVGGILSFYLYRFGRLAMNDPPTAVGGIQTNLETVWVGCL